MKRSTITIFGTAILCLGTLIGGFQLGSHHQAAKDGHTASGAAATTGSARGNASNRGSTNALRSRDREATAKPLTVKQILAKVNASMRGGSMQNPSSMMRVMGLLDKIRPEDVQEALAEAEAITDPQARGMVVMCLLAKWAEIDGPAAMKYAEEHATGSGPMGQMGKMSVAGAWAEQDPEAVWEWYQEQSDKGGGGTTGGSLALVSLFASMAEHDLDLAFKRLAEIGGPGKLMALTGMFQSALFDDDKRLQILEKVDALPDEDERKQAKQMMLGQWAMLAPEQAVEWVKTQPQAEQRELREIMGTMLMMSDPKKGADWMMEGVTDEEMPKAYSQVVSRWASMDANAAATWLKEQPQGPQLDEARKSFVNATSQKDPPNAMAWAATITNPDLRVKATKTAYQAWQAKDSAAADQALANSGLDEAQIQAVKAGQSPPKPTNQ